MIELNSSTAVQERQVRWASFDLLSWFRPKSTAIMATLLLHLITDASLFASRPLAIAICGFLLFVKPLRKHPLPWIVLCLNAGIFLWQQRWLADNHIYLIFYWQLALAIAFTFSSSEQTMRTSARYLIAACFLFATAAKIESPQFLQTTVTQYTLLTDGRFATLTTSLSNLTHDQLETNQDGYNKVQSGHSATHTLLDAKSIRPLAILVVTWTLLVEGIIGLLFLLPSHSRLLQGVRNALLLLFMATTYAVAPVLNFGRILTILGIAQCQKEQRLTPLIFVAFFFTLELFDTFDLPLLFL